MTQKTTPGIKGIGRFPEQSRRKNKPYIIKRRENSKSLSGPTNNIHLGSKLMEC
jgi:hypothetical protein